MGAPFPQNFSNAPQCRPIPLPRSGSVQPCAAANGGIASLLQSARLVAAVAELGSLGEQYWSRFQQVIAMRLSVIFIVTMVLMGSLTAVLLFKQRQQSEQLAELEHRCSELQSSLQARESQIEDLRANRSTGSPRDRMAIWSADTQLVHQLGEMAQTQSNMMIMLKALTNSPSFVVLPERTAERAQKEFLHFEQIHNEQATKLLEYRSEVQELEKQLRISDEIAQMDPSTGLDRVSLQAFWPYFEAKRRRNSQERVAETTKLRLLQARADLQAVADTQIP